MAEVSEGRTIGDPETLLIKEEITEGDTLTGFLDEETLTTLADILDENRSWEKLAKLLKYDYLLSTLHTMGSSPSRTILNCADVRYSIDQLKARPLQSV